MIHELMARPALLIILLLVAASACGQGADRTEDGQQAADASSAPSPVATSDDDAAASEPGSGDDAALTTCKNLVETERLTSVSPELGVEYFEEHDVVEVAPDEIKEPVTTLFTMISKVAETGDYGPLFGARFDRADLAIDEYMLEHCGWDTLTYTVDDDGYADFPDTVPAGYTALEINNTGADVHEGQIFRLNEGEEPKDVLESPTSNPFTEARYVGGNFTTGKGHSVADDNVRGTKVTFIKLEPGHYVIDDGLPVGAATFKEVDKLYQDQNAKVTIHGQQGVRKEFTVA